ncbi:MAG TPA: cache domain-containing protein [Rhodocyclaceae bacterium]|nr:cache domain-containing protein [Rhodocyclaceae bacterium]
MQLKHKIVLLAVLPLMLAIAAIAFLGVLQARELAQAEAANLEEAMLAAKRQELRNYISLALTSIDHLYASGRDDEATKAEAKRILEEMSFGDDGYFFVYDFSGRNLMHPRLRDLVGKNLWEMRDANGVPVIQRLVERARSGGGFVRYLWNKPSTGEATEKLAYAVELKRWQWMIGTGIYLDDVAAGSRKLRDEISLRIQRAMLALAILAAFASLAVFAGGMILNVSEHRLADRRLKALAQRIVSSQEEERGRVSRELHDGLSQVLVSVKFRFEQAQQKIAGSAPEAAQFMDQGLAALGGALSELRRISHDLRPSALDDLGLHAALRQLAVEFGERSGVAVDTDVEAPGPILRGEAAISLFRIAQEALTNVERHAGARRVWVALHHEGEALRLSIRDDGAGFDPARVDHPGNGGIGLRNMRERIEHFGGTLAVKSGADGTEIAASLPADAFAEGSPS